MIDRLARGTIYSRRWVLDLLLLFAIVVLIILLAGQRTTYHEVIQLGEQNNQLLKEVKSCTDPSGTCAKRGQESTATAVSNINKITLMATYCANRQPPPAVLEDVRKCVAEELKKSP